MIYYAGHLVTAIVGANDGDDRSNACVMLSHELESLLEPQFRGKSVDRVNAAEEVLRLRQQNDVTGDGGELLKAQRICLGEKVSWKRKSCNASKKCKDMHWILPKNVACNRVSMLSVHKNW